MHTTQQYSIPELVMHTAADPIDTDELMPNCAQVSDYGKLRIRVHEHG